MISLLFVLALCAAYRVTNVEIDSSSDFLFLEKFCYDQFDPDSGEEHSGSAVWTQLTVDKPATTHLVVYDDQNGQWGDIYGNSDLSCNDKVSMSLMQCNFSTGAACNTKAKPWCCVNTDGSLNMSVTNNARPRYWFMAMADCSSDGGVGVVKYSAHFLQGSPGVSQEVSFDQQGLLETYAVFLVVWLVMLALNGYGTLTLIKMKAFHPIIRLYTLALVFGALSVLFHLVHRSAFAGNGVGFPALRGFGVFFDYVSQIFFMMLLLVLAQGWAITNQTLEYQKQLLAVLAAVLVCSIVTFFWSLFGVDPATDVFEYQTAPGVILLIIRMAVFATFLFFLGRTYRVEERADKKMFYLMFGIAYSLWFLALPLIVAIAAASEMWYREKLTTAAYVIVNSLAYSLLQFTFWPTRAAKYFEISSPALVATAATSSSSYGAI